MFIFPVGKQKKLRKLPWITISLIIINLFVFFQTWPDTYENYVELENVTSRLETQKQTVEQLETEVKAIQQQQETFSKPPSNSYYSYKYAAYYARQENASRFNLETKQNSLISAKEETKKLEYKLESIKENNLFMIWGYIASKGEPWRLITYQFLHSGYMHLIFNLFFLWFVGCNVEDKWGKWVFLGFYLVSGIVAAVVNNMVTPSGDVPLVGASGAIAGAMGAFMIRYPTTKVKVFYLFIIGFIPKFGLADWPAWLFLILWFFGQLLSGMFSIYMEGDSVAYWAHIGGFVFGSVIALMMKTTGFEKKYIEPNIVKEEKKLLGVHTVVLDAKEKLEEGDHIKAEEMLRELINKEPDCLEAYVELLEILKKFHSKFTDEMKSYILKILELGAKNNNENACISAYYINRELTWQKYSLTLKTLMYLARTVDSRGDFSESVSLYKKITEEYAADPLSNKAFFSLGRIYIALGKKDKAIEIFKKLMSQPEGYHYKDRIEQECLSNFGKTLENL
ncbi:MAG: hypothetical protein A2252_07245 [Elusimicrobia bacterium RIFOXYA2_FULL_39_19]|nr:MAG: hypothetical protein A2252_07245 [Elusimicrobia bacterium RIFOXYA2_FULL_39_19]